MHSNFKSSHFSPPEILSGKWKGEVGDHQLLDALSFADHWLKGQKQFSIETSGSTGIPKTILLDRERMELSARATLTFLGLTAADHAFLCLSSKHIGGKMMIVRALIGNLRLSIAPVQSDPLIHEAAEHPYTFTALVPRQLRSIALRDEGIAQLKRFKAILVGGAEVDMETKLICSKEQLPVYQTFGMTETLSHFAMRNLGAGDDSYSVLPGFEIGTDVDQSLWIKGKICGTEKVQSNDIIELSEPGKFRWLGRKDYVINSGGIKLHPEVLEDKIRDLIPNQRAFFLGGIPDTEWGEKLVLIIEGTEVHGDLLSSIKTRLGSIASPKEIYYIPKFSRTPTDKIKRFETLQIILNQSK
jgi:O-succinylbenzoic acid--CoA ligase